MSTIGDPSTGAIEINSPTAASTSTSPNTVFATPIKSSPASVAAESNSTNNNSNSTSNGLISYPVVISAPHSLAALETSGQNLLPLDSNYSQIIHSFPLVSRQTAAGIASIKRIAEYLKRICIAKKHYAEELLKATSLESVAANANTGAGTGTGTSTGGSKSPRSKENSILSANKANDSTAGLIDIDSLASNSNCIEDDSMSRSYNVYLDLHESEFQEANELSETANNILTTVVQPLNQFYRDASSKYKLIIEHQRNLEFQMKSTRDVLLKSKIHCMKLLEQLKTAEERERIEGSALLALNEAKKAGSNNEKSTNQSSNTSSSTSGFGSFLNKLKINTNKTEKDHPSSEQLRELAYCAALEYSSAVSTANSRQIQYYQLDLPNVFQSLQKLETARLETLKIHLGQLALSNCGLQAPNQQRAQSLSDAVSAMSSKEDISDYVNSIINTIGPVNEPDPYKFDIPFQPEAIRSNLMDQSIVNNNSNNNNNSIFGLSLEQCMANQSIDYPDIDIPIILSAIIQTIKQLNGINRVGLFRAAGKTAEVTALRTELDNGNYSALKSVTNVDTAAAVLKQWLRELPAPLIIPQFYTAAIQIARTESDLINQSGATIDIYEHLPELNQRILLVLSELLYDIAATSADDIRHTITQTSIVFTNILLRPSTSNNTINPSDLVEQKLNNSKLEIKFTAALIYSLGSKSANNRKNRANSNPAGTGTGSSSNASSPVRTAIPAPQTQSQSQSQQQSQSQSQSSSPVQSRIDDDNTEFADI